VNERRARATDPSAPGPDRRGRWRRRLRHWAIDIVLLTLIIVGVRTYLGRDMAQGEAPSLTANRLDGTPVRLADPGGEPVLVHFWATWCRICHFEQGAIRSIAKDHRVLTVALRSGSDAELKAYRLDRQLAFPILNDPEGRMAGQFGVTAVPATFIIDDRGRIRARIRGLAPEPELRFRLWWAGR